MSSAIQCKKMKCNRNVYKSSCTAPAYNGVMPSNTVNGWPVRVQPNSVGANTMYYWGLKYPVIINGKVVPPCCVNCIKPLTFYSQGNQPFIVLNPNA